MVPRVGIALAVHNSRDLTRECLQALFGGDYRNLHVVVVDDGSSDGTWEMLRQDYPEVVALRGDGNLWWTGATNRAVRECLQAGCEFVQLLNPDVTVGPTVLSTLVDSSTSLGMAIVAPAVLDRDDPQSIWEAGHRWGPVTGRCPLIWASRKLYKRGARVSELPREPYATVSLVGRGGLIPRSVFETIGLFDEKRLPHYGADVDLGLRAWRAGLAMYIVPAARVLLHTGQTGMGIPRSLGEAIRQYGRHLLSRKHGEALRVQYFVHVKNLPLYAAIPSYLFVLALNTFRYWQGFVRARGRRP